MDETKKEPTTAEAFATLCRLADWVSAQDADMHSFDGTAIGPPLTEAREALALLERRMGAMARALDAIASDGVSLPGHVEHAVRAALTDAPPVFTLEEVIDTMLDAGKDMKGDDTPADFRDYVSERLTALRGTGGWR